MRGGVDNRIFFDDDNFDVRRGVDDWIISIDDAFSVRREYDPPVLLFIRVPCLHRRYCSCCRRTIIEFEEVVERILLIVSLQIPST